MARENIRRLFELEAKNFSHQSDISVVLLNDLEGECLLESNHGLDLLLDPGSLLRNLRLNFLLVGQGLLHGGYLRF